MDRAGGDTGRDDVLHEAFVELVDGLRAAEERLRTTDPPLAEPDRLDGYRWIFSLLAVGLDAYVWADTGRPRFVDIVGPHRKWGGDNVDAFYQLAPIDPARTYRVRCVPGDAVYVSLTVYGGPDDGRYSERIVGTLNDRTMHRNPDGSFDLVLSPEEPRGDGEVNWLRFEPDAVVGITRDYLAEPTTGRRAVWSIEADDPPAAPTRSAADLARRFAATTTWLAEQVQICPVRVEPVNEVQEPYPVPTATFGWAAGDAAYAMGSYELADGEALVIDGRSPGCAFWNLCLWNPFLHVYDAEYDRVTINGHQVVPEPDENGDGVDGTRWRIVVAADDPGHPNWVATQGRTSGLLWFRWFLPTATPARPTCRVVPVTEVGA